MEKMFNGILAKYKPFRLIPATVTIAFFLHSLSVLKLPVDWEIVIEWQDKMCMKKARFRATECRQCLPLLAVLLRQENENRTNRKPG